MNSRAMWIAAISGWFWIMENRFFGWNALPQSADELICDGIALLILAIAIHAGSNG